MVAATENPLYQAIVTALQSIYDPELPLNIYELGLIYDIDLSNAPQRVVILMTLTTPNCPAAESLPAEVQQAIKSLPTIEEVEVRLTFDPPYSIDRLSESAKLALGIT